MVDEAVPMIFPRKYAWAVGVVAEANLTAELTNRCFPPPRLTKSLPEGGVEEDFTHLRMKWRYLGIIVISLLYRVFDCLFEVGHTLVITMANSTAPITTTGR